MLKNNKNLLYIIACIIVFAIIAFIYANPVLSGKQLFQHDIVQYKGGAKELLDYRAENGKETYWSDSMFGGMPTYQMGAQFRGDIIKQIDNVLMFFPKPVNYLFLLFSGFFLLGMVVIRNWKYALLGATFFGLSTYFYIIIAAGHNGKVHTIAYFAPVVAGLLLLYLRKNYVAGFIVTALFMGLQIAANHPQMTYYLFLGLGFLFLSELYRAITKKTNWKHFLVASGLAALAVIVGVGMNAQRIMSNAEYVKETVRGKQILTHESQASGKTGMEKESILMWSYGKLETLNLFIPRLMGGGSSEPEGEQMMATIQEMVQNNVSSQQEMDMISKGLQSLTYWGDQPGTSGPAYQGAIVCFLAFLGFFFAPRKYTYWIVGASTLTILLAWGSNFIILSDIFIDYVPFYNKFRAPSSILVVVELLFPLIAIVGLYNFFNNKNLTSEYKKKVLLYAGTGVVAFLVILVGLAKPLLGFATENEKTYLPPYILDFLVSERYSMFKTDAIKTLLYVGITLVVLWMVFLQKLNKNIALVIIGLVSIFDLWSVNKKYLNESNFVDNAFATNPFQTEVSDVLIDKVGSNQNLMGLLENAKTNKALEDLATNDKGHYRVFNTVLSPFNETNTSYFKSSIGGYHAVKLRRYDDLINGYFGAMDSVKTPRILNMLNAKYWVVGNREEPQIIPNQNTNGNAWFVSNVKFAKDPNEEFALIGEIDNKKTAVIGIEDKAYFQGKAMKSDSTATISLTKYAADELSYKTKSATPQLAVFSEIYYPNGWKIMVDNEEVPYIKANYLLRAVHIPAGEHEVRMVFDPQVIHTGKTVSLIIFIGFILLSIGLLAYERKRKKHIQKENLEIV